MRDKRTRIAKLLRFHSTAAAGDAAEVTLEDYVSRMKAGSKGHLLPHRRYARRRAQQSASGGLSRQGHGSVCCSPTASTNGWPDICTSSRASRSPTSRAPPPTWPPPSKPRRRPPPNPPIKETLERLGKTLARQDRERPASRPPHRFAGGAGRRRVRRELAHGTHPQAGRPEQSVCHPADSRIESRSIP